MSRPAKTPAGRHDPTGNSAVLGAAITASAAPAIAAIDPDDRLLTLRARWMTALAELNRLLDRQRLVEERCDDRFPDLPQDADEAIRDDHKRRCAAIEREEGMPELQAAITAAHEEENSLTRIIGITHAHTLRGLAVKVEVSASRQHGEDALVASIMADVLTVGAIAHGV